MTQPLDTPEWLQKLESRHMVFDLAGALEQLDYKAGVMVDQALMLQRDIDAIRKMLVAKGIIGERKNDRIDT